MAVVIVGAGMAGVQTAVALREQGYTGSLTLLGAEPHPPYDRPPLSKDVLLGRAEHSRFEIDFDELGIGLALGRRALSLDAEARTIRTDAGDLGYEHLVLATGAAPITLPGLPASAFLLRTQDDALALRAALRPGTRVVVVGAGWIGAEAATVARQLGCEVTVVEAAGSPLAGALPTEFGERTRAWYAAAGARLLTASAVGGVTTGSVQLTDGRELPADVVVVGIGARPDNAWLAGSGIPLDDRGAVRADARLRAGRDEVFAVGDCASFPSARYGRRLAVHHWDNALQGARVVAANILGGELVYDPVPYFWSEQFDHMVQVAGVIDPAAEQVARGEDTVLWLRKGRLEAVLTVDKPRDLAQGRKLIDAGALIDPTKAADPGIQLKAAGV
ncbi:NAD(P)/FAD-dependent oxidoreductase [Streptacidiphilus jiangxiensis]|uniref:NADPH-dependent 2,4-dienoyl-CoA reductase, sulfur reductase n=1 Tax=Streptacidiphilus jiangxiensis TaxID=235985 RepID=A0A1H7SPS1_STRJI|nr:FAD-dependent oxidoreductase [Streptacidiphilus jiangxiensis]SEL74650.1 NADPH-dependent 2,4-dienoyl-CoA reductase, sulfur reductase [Streptacidiphilus jiangxiensis]